MKRHLSGAVRLGAGRSRARSHHLTVSPTGKSPRREGPADFQLGFFSIFFFQLVSPADFPVATSMSTITSKTSLPCFTPYLQEDGTPWSCGCPASGFCPPSDSIVVRLCPQQCQRQLLCVCQCDLTITRQKSIPSPFLPSPPRAPQQQS